MNINEYMKWTRATAIYPKEMGVVYCALGLAGESGEVADKVKKIIRDKNYDKSAILKELGDVLWYWARLCDELDADPEQVMQDNVNKLLSRKDRGCIGGSGDNR